MKIVVMSDLHLEGCKFGHDMPRGDVLVLAGDITVLGIFDKDCDLYHQKNADAARDRMLALIEQANTNFGAVVYLAGNHEAYGYDINLLAHVVGREFPGITFLDDKAVDLDDGVILVGGTLWTDMNQGNDAWIVGQGMNDFHLITEGGGRFYPHHAMTRFDRTKKLIADTADKHTRSTIVVATHHAPSRRGISRDRVRSRINHGYYTDLERFIADRPNIRQWIHGHTHIQKRYQIAQCEVISNARGYSVERCAAKFKPDVSFDPTQRLSVAS